MISSQPLRFLAEAERPAKPATKARPSRGKGRRVEPVALTLGALGARYLAHLKDEGKSLGTITSYTMELATAARELGEETPVGALTAARVQAYFESDVVTKTRQGAPKAKPTVDKTRRVLRLALVWAAEEGLIEQAPIPEARTKES